MIWFLSGSTNVKNLQSLGANIWNPWESKEFEEKHHYAEGSLGPVYGFQLRHFDGNYPDKYDQEIADKMGIKNFYGMGGVDQLKYMLNLLKEDPKDRRILFSLWNPKQIDNMRLPPCHYTFQLFVDDQGRMSGHLTQRSNDYPVGVCANIQFYSALIYMFAQQTEFTPYEFIHEAVDAHIYENQIPAVERYLQTPIINSPTLELRPAEDMFNYKPSNFVLHNFRSGPKIDIPVAV